MPKTWMMIACVLAVGCGDSGDGSSAAGGPGSGAPMDGGDGGGDGDGDDPPGVGPAVGQGGAQDFGQFRAILEAGLIPGPETLDDVGFFGEHRIPLGDPDCGESVCLHGHLAVMGDFASGSNLTMLMLGMTTPIDPETIDRPPLNLALAIDSSGSMLGPAIEYVRDGLSRLSGSLRPEDRITLVTFSDGAQIHVENVAGDAPELESAIAAVEASGQTNIYAGLRAAFEAVARHADPALSNRVILLSDGQATTGLVHDPRLLTMAEAYSAAGFGLSTIGVGSDFDPELMRGLAERGGGAFYFLEDPAAVVEVFEEEADAFLMPLATEVEIEAAIGEGYAMKSVIGTRLAELDAHGTWIEIPSLQVAHRESADDDESGRRGGGGAIVSELIPDLHSNGDGPVATLTLRYRVPHTEDVVEQIVEVESPLRPGETPQRGHFSSDGAEKAFVTLNLYLGFERAAEQAAAGDLRGALGGLLVLSTLVSEWEAGAPDPDIADDLRYVDLFIANLRAAGAEDPP